MKIRTDFVTNSSSSSFILGKPKGNTITVKEAKKYIKSLKEKLGLETGILCSHIIDLRYDENIQYTEDEIQFIVETLLWYADDAQIVDYLITDSGEYFELDEFSTYTKEQTKRIIDYAYEKLGEVLLGNTEIGFYPIEAWYDGISKDPNIRFKCNHMG